MAGGLSEVYQGKEGLEGFDLGTVVSFMAGITGLCMQARTATAVVGLYFGAVQ